MGNEITVLCRGIVRFNNRVSAGVDNAKFKNEHI